MGPAASVDAFTPEAGRTYRATLSYDNPYCTLEGFDKNTRVTLVTVSAQTMKESTSISLDLLPVTPGEKVTFTRKNFTPNAITPFILHPNPVGLGAVKVAADGIFTAEVTTPSDMPTDDHRLIAFDAADGELVSIPLAVAVLVSSNSPAAEPGPQSETQSSNGGSSSIDLFIRTDSSTPLVLFGAVLVAGAETLLLLHRRTARSRAPASVQGRRITL